MKRTGHLLSTATDWQVLIDLDNEPIVFPPTIYATPLRPDIVIWSEEAKIVIWAELTCPAEENIQDAKTRKTERYANLSRRMHSSLVDRTSLHR